METSTSHQEQQQDPWFLKSSAPVFLPTHHALTLPQSQFQDFLQQESNIAARDDDSGSRMGTVATASATPSLPDAAICHANDMNVDDASAQPEDTTLNNHPFMQGILSKSTKRVRAEDDNFMRTQNLDLAYRSTKEPLVDLFSELEDAIIGTRLHELLASCWNHDALATLKIIFNSRSIHLGKASRYTFYRCAGWLATNHPYTLIHNLPWLTRPVIPKKVEKLEKKDELDDWDVVVDSDESDEHNPACFDVKNGVAHGYWKDLLNLLVLHAENKLDGITDPRDVLNVKQEKGSTRWPKSQEEAKSSRHETRTARHQAVIERLTDDPIYRALHISVARLFAEQLRTDLDILNRSDTAAKRRISLCAKWAPSADRFHDKHTFIVSSIAEIMHPLSSFPGFKDYDPSSVDQRTFYLRHAREAYRKDIAALRKHLGVVERDITASTFGNIKYDRIPSLAMHNYAELFAKKDTDRFGAYIEQVASGQARISGATLLPSAIIKLVREGVDEDTNDEPFGKARKSNARGAKNFVMAKIEDMTRTTLDLQWKSLVQRIKDSGTLENCIAIADVSGSMMSPRFSDGTCPMDSSIALSLLIAEVTKPPFGGAFITFSTNPTVQRVDLSSSLQDKYLQLCQADWAMSTDFVAVFEKLILPMAIENKLKREDMVKRVFVFSDMHFDSASSGRGSTDRWSTSYERIERHFQEAGYEMPELVFWNLAGGQQPAMPQYFVAHPPPGFPIQSPSDVLNIFGAQRPPQFIAPKPVDASTKGTALVSGYSQAMLKIFLEGSSFDEDAPEDDLVEKTGDFGEVVIDRAKRRKLEQMDIVKKAIGHKAYSMLRVVD